jgi:hypothetical protein
LDNGFDREDCDETMSTIHQLANAFLAGMFGAALLITAHLFAEYRAVKIPPFHLVHAIRPL